MKQNVALLRKQNPEFKHCLFDDTMCRNFIKEHFDDSVLWAFDKLKPGAYKADLWRYCVLYIHGGIYLDIKYRCANGFKLTALTDREYWVRDRLYFIDNKYPAKHGIYQALLVCNSQNEKLLQCIRSIVRNCETNAYNNNDLDVCGPHALARFFDEKQDILSSDLYFTGDSIRMKGSNSKGGDRDREILTVYREYRQEQSRCERTPYYKTMWIERDIYSYPTLQFQKRINLSHSSVHRINGRKMRLYSGTPTIIQDPHRVGQYIINFRWINYEYRPNGSRKSVPKQWVSKNSRYRLNSDFKKISQEVFLQEDFEREKTYWGMGLEDMRIFHHAVTDKTYYIATHFDPKRCITSMSSDRYSLTKTNTPYSLERRIILPTMYDTNKTKIPEKNWNFFDYRGNLRVVYKWSPVQICEIDFDNQKLNLTEERDVPEYFRDARGTSSGFTCPNGEIWFVLHKAQTYEKDSHTFLNYQHFFAVFDNDMNLLRYSELFKLGDAKVEFCIGLIIESERTILSYSLLDTQSYIATYSNEYIRTGIKWYET